MPYASYQLKEGNEVILGIVGSEEAKFTLGGTLRAIKAIQELVQQYGATGIASGHCHLGGVDIFAEDVAKDFDIFDRKLIFPAKVHTWSHPQGFRARNIQIAKACDVCVCISVNKLPSDYKGMRFNTCYHCIQRGEFVPHVKSGGCWTRWYAHDLGRKTELIVVRN